MVFATKSPTSEKNLIDNYIALTSDPGTHPLVLAALERTVLYMQLPPSEGIIFTDDKAPVELITNSMISNFFLSGEFVNLQ